MLFFFFGNQVISVKGLKVDKRKSEWAYLLGLLVIESSILLVFKIVFIFIYMQMRLWSWYLLCTEKGIGFPGARVSNGCEPPDMGTRN